MRVRRLWQRVATVVSASSVLVGVFDDAEDADAADGLGR
jgi:hypothetical protein